jgi:hypothetical protein
MGGKEIGGESIFAGKSAEERQEKREDLAASRRSTFRGLKALTEKLEEPEPPMVVAAESEKKA